MGNTTSIPYTYINFRFAFYLVKLSPAVITVLYLYPRFAQVCHANPSERARFIRCIYNLLQSSSPAVKYEAAGTLVTLSSAPTAIKVEHLIPAFSHQLLPLRW